MISKPRPTEFLPAERAAPGELRRQERFVASDRVLTRVLDAVTEIVVILNAERQIVYANRAAVERIRAAGGSPEVGARWGQALGCEHAADDCGTTSFCRNCGAARAIIGARRGDAREECRISRPGGACAFDFLVSTTRLQLNGEELTVFTALDLEDHKRREALERIFFHDVLNTAGAVRGLAELLSETPPERQRQFISALLPATDHLIEELYAQRDLALAESGDLSPRPQPVDSLPLLLRLAATAGDFGPGRDKKVVVVPEAANVRFESDPTLVRRVVMNMLKNALEASKAGDEVTLGCGKRAGRAELWVRNPGVMPAEARAQVFQRSFTTKGPGRGLGTYSMKLLTERYLGGKISFESAPGRGTRFTAAFPLELPKPAA